MKHLWVLLLASVAWGQELEYPAPEDWTIVHVPTLSPGTPNCTDWSQASTCQWEPVGSGAQGGTAYSKEWPQGEDQGGVWSPPMDVSAIQEELPGGRGCLERYDGCWVLDKDGKAVTNDRVWGGDWTLLRFYRWTCADKSRILLTAEDGSRHCLKF